MQNQIETPEVRKMSVIERSQARMKVAMQNQSQLKRWIEESGRRWLVFNSSELVDALPWPAGVETLMQLIACYRDHRRTVPSTTGDGYKPETLEVVELDRAIRYLIGRVTELDSSWSLNHKPL